MCVWKDVREVMVNHTISKSLVLESRSDYLSSKLWWPMTVHTSKNVLHYKFDRILPNGCLQSLIRLIFSIKCILVRVGLTNKNKWNSKYCVHVCKLKDSLKKILKLVLPSYFLPPCNSKTTIFLTIIGHVHVESCLRYY